MNMTMNMNMNMNMTMTMNMNMNMTMNINKYQYLHTKSRHIFRYLQYPFLTPGVISAFLSVNYLLEQ